MLKNNTVIEQTFPYVNGHTRVYFPLNQVDSVFAETRDI